MGLDSGYRHAQFSSGLLLKCRCRERRGGITGARFLLDARNRIGKIDGMIQAALEKNVLGEISSDTFRRLVGKYEAEQQQLQGEVNQWEREQSECRQAKRDVGTWISRIKECLTIDELTRTIAVELIDRIVVSQMREEGGEKVLDLEIFYKFGLKQSDQVNPVYENRAS